ncbi:MAG: dialkylresorcinol condensing enzyme DarA [Mesonia hippocampi]|uniref:dialkylrecorsinol condensing enzyme DarA n=1 Tax=Mesonia hippocampi TaxID=1628250 RepID=UPI003F976B57
MKKKVLLIYYSQSGQLKEITQQITKPLLKEDQIQVDVLTIKMETDFPFPWTSEAFFDVFPDTFLQESHAIKPVSETILKQEYNLILFAYQPWYLSPSIPANSFLKSSYAQQLFSKGVPVVSIIGSRNMWAMAQEKVKQLLKNYNTTLVGNIVLADRNPNLISAYTIVKWMFTGEKRKFGIFPKPGISQAEINASDKFGEVILKHLKSNNYNKLQTDLLEKGAVEIPHFLIQIDKTANKMFTKWANAIKNKKGKSRKRWLKGFYYYLVIAIWILSPIVNVIYWLIYPFRYKKIKKETTYFRGV